MSHTVLITAVMALVSFNLACALNGQRPNSGPSDTPIAVTPPRTGLVGGSVANRVPPGPFLQDFQPPFPTNSWWTGFAVANQDGIAAGPLPFYTVTRNTGLDFGIGETRSFDGRWLREDPQLDWRASYDGLPNNLRNRKATSWDTQTVCLQYFGGPSTMDSCLVPGSPYMTFKYVNAAVTLTSTNGSAFIQWITPGRKATLTNSGGTYLLYVLNGNLNLTKRSNSVIASPPGFSGTVRMAKLKGASQEAVLDSFSRTYPTALDMSYSIDGNSSEQVWTWRTVGDPRNLLMLSLPHHRKVLKSPTFVDIQYLTIKGFMKGVQGDRWILTHDLPTVSWFAPNDPDQSCRSQLNETLEEEVNMLIPLIPIDFYFWGGAFARAAQLATIAEHVGRPDLVTKAVSILKQSIEPWFNAARKPAATYETGWGGVINGNGVDNVMVDFGNAYYYDHHYQYGYLLHGAAVIGKYDNNWLNQHIDFLTHVARDIGNPSPSDPYYTVTRHLDWFAGHSWANGITNVAREQESSSEAVNGYYGLLLFAQATQNQELEDYARMLIAIEIAGAQTYWHLYPAVNDPDTPYPEQNFRDLVSVGTLRSTEAGAWLSWGDQKIQISGMQILPVTPLGQELYDRPWMEQVLPFTEEELNNDTLDDDFKSLIITAYATVDPQQAALKSASLADWGTAHSASNELYFISTQPSTTSICTPQAPRPVGTFQIKDVASGKFVALNSDDQLAATSSLALASKFTVNSIPGGSSIQAVSTDKYVTANRNGTSPLAATKDFVTPSEKFRWSKQSDGTYQLTALTNKKKVSTASNGQLVNNGVASNYMLIPTANSPAPDIPAQGVLRNAKNNRYAVIFSTFLPVLAAIGTSSSAIKWKFEQLASDSSDSSPKYGIKNQLTNKYVTSNLVTLGLLAVTSDTVGPWERFQIMPLNGGFVLIHVATGLPVRVRLDSIMIITSDPTVDNSAVWFIE